VTAEQAPLFGDADRPTGRGPAGPVEQATRRSLNAAALDAVDEGAGQALLTLAWALDAARVAGKFYGVAQAAPPYLEQARALGLVLDAGKEGSGDAVDAWLRGLTSPTMGDPAQP
jgi:hypothetical protein